MSLVEVTNPADKIEIVGQFKNIQVRSATWVEKDGVRIGQPQYHRHVVSPGESSDIPEVQAVIDAVHTQEVIDAYAAHLAAQANNL